jgi:hypothetical protein
MPAPFRTAAAAVAAIPAGELLRDGLMDIGEAMNFTKKTRAEIKALVRSGVIPTTRGANRSIAIPTRALAALLAFEWENRGQLVGG